MKPSSEDLIAQAQALIAQARQGLQGGEAFFQQQGAAAGEAFRRANREAEEELQHFAFGQLRLAQQRPALPAQEIEVDAATRFARHLSVRRVIV